MSFRSRTIVSAFSVALLCVLSANAADDWPQFRGPQGDGTANASTAVEISAKNTVWKTAIPGAGWSSPVVSDGKIWITTAETSKASREQIAKKTAGVQFAQMKTVAGRVKLRALCVDLESGKILHDLLLKDISDPELSHPLNSYASPTAAISGDRVVCHFGNYGTWCLDKTSGKTLWENALVVDHSVGPGSSPVIADGIVLIVCDGIDKQFVAGLNLETGKQVWKTPRPGYRKSNGEFRKAYSTPLLIKVGQQVQAVVPGAQWVCAYEPQTGKEIWRADCGDGFSTTPMAIYEAGLVVISTGFMAPELVGINPEGSGDITKTNIVWRARKGGSTMPTAVGHNGMVYSLSDGGVLTVMGAKDGKILDQGRVGGKFCASPLMAGGKLYFGSQEGVLSVYGVKEANGSQQMPKVLAKNKLDGALMASPAVIGSDLIIRTSKSLMRVKPE